LEKVENAERKKRNVQYIFVSEDLLAFTTSISIGCLNKQETKKDHHGYQKRRE
jgi:hypothetical protein